MIAAQLDRRRQPRGRQLRLVRHLRGRQPRHRRHAGAPDRWARRCSADTDCFLSVRPDSDSRRRRPATAAADLHARRDRRQRRPDAHARAHAAAAWRSTAASARAPRPTSAASTRPQNGTCDIGAFEFVGPAAAGRRRRRPTREYLSGPIQDTLETVAFTFTGSDNQTRDRGAPVRVPADRDRARPRSPSRSRPWEPVPPELQWARLLEPVAGAADRGGHVHASRCARSTAPATSTRRRRSTSSRGADTSPPDTIIVEKPPLRQQQPHRDVHLLGHRQPDAAAVHRVRVPARLARPGPLARVLQPDDLRQPDQRRRTRSRCGRSTATENMDPTPARYTWTVGQLRPNCDAANITLTAGRRRLGRPGQPDRELPLRDRARRSARARPATRLPCRRSRSSARTPARCSASRCPPTRRDCELESATLRLYAESPTEGRTLEAVPLAGTWKESTLTWFNQPGDAGRRRPRRRAPRPRATRSGTCSSHVAGDARRAASTTAGRSATRTRTTRTAATSRSSAARCRRTRRRADAAAARAALRGRRDAAAAAAGRAGDRADDRSLRPGAHGEHAGRERPASTASVRASSSARRTSCVDLNGHTIDEPAICASNRARRRASPPASATAATRTSSSATAPSRTSATACC